MARLELPYGRFEGLPQWLRSLVTLAQHPGAVVFFGEVGQMEVARECPGDGRGPRQRPGCDQSLRLALVRRVLARPYHRTSEQLDVAQQPGAIFGNDLPEDLTQHADVAPELRRYFLP